MKASIEKNQTPLTINLLDLILDKIPQMHDFSSVVLYFSWNGFCQHFTFMLIVA